MSQTAKASWEQATKRAAFVTLTMLIGFAPAAMLPNITSYFYRTQDAAASVLLIAALVVLARRSPNWRLPTRAPSTPAVVAIAAVFVALLWLGTHLVMLNYPLTRDEHMVVFDAANFSAGRIGNAIPPHWAGYSLALVPSFLLVTHDFHVLASSYLPGNAALRAAFSAIADPALLNPLLAGVGTRSNSPDRSATVRGPIGPGLDRGRGICPFGADRGERDDRLCNDGALGVQSGVAAALLRGGIVGHAGAMAVGSLAIGLHQPIFHPLFAGPFVLWLAIQGRWKLFAIYGAVYAGAMLFWLSWISIVVASVGGVNVDGGSAAGAGGFIVERVLPLVSRIDRSMPALMAANGLRGLAWNAAFLLPLVIVAIMCRSRIGPVATCLLAGVGLTLVAMAVLLPYQGHGWGYRYIHGVLGSIILLAGYGWQALDENDRGARQGAIVALGLVTIGLMTFQMWQAHHFVAQHARLAGLIEAQRADFVVVDTDTTTAAIDEVRNLPDLSNRPLVFASHALNAAQVRELCRRGTIATVGMQAFPGINYFAESTDRTAPRFSAITDLLEKERCLVSKE